MMIALRTALVGGLLMTSTLAYAEHSGSAEDQMACTPDVYRLCTAEIPDEDAIVACLKKHRAVLSAGCAHVFAQPNPGSTKDNGDAD